MIYLLDSNIISAMLKQDQTVIEKTKNAYRDGNTLCISAYNHFEILRGLELPEHQRRYNDYQQLLLSWEILEFNLITFEIAASIYQNLKRQGELIEDPDLLIAANAMQHSATLVTDNTKHFARIWGLRLENWIDRT
jgi:tRNA(fMet)-specific endonuclease VapC